MKTTVEATQNWHEVVAEKETRIAEQETCIAKQETRIAELEALVRYYEEQFRLHKHRQFGAKSEKSQYIDGFVQQDLFNEAEATSDENPETAPEPELREVQRHFRKRKRLVNDTLPDNIPIEIVEHGLDESEKDCPECGEQLHVMGRGEKRRVLVVIPATVKIREHVSLTYGCRSCEQTAVEPGDATIINAPLPAPVIKNSFASPEAIAHIMYQKFVMGAPLYRQEKDWERQGIMLSRQTMSNWLISATKKYLEPIYNALLAILLTLQVLHSDETHLQVLHEPGKAAQTKSSMWLYRTGSDAKFPIVLYEYQPDKSAERPKKFLKNFKGYLHTDGANYYHSLPPDIVVVGCIQHARRKFTDALKTMLPKDRPGSKVAEGKKYCDRLFDLERDFADLTPEERYEKRQQFSKPLLEEFFAWAENHSHLTKTPLGKAVHYLLGQRKYLENFLLDGRLEISNNRAERSIKPFVIDRKNFLFANTTRGATASAIMFSIIETAKDNGLNPFKYLVHIFKTAAGHDAYNDPDLIQSLLPQNLHESLRIKFCN